MQIQQNISLKKYNTFGINVIAKRFISVTSIEELQQVLEKEKDIFLISGGSNMLLTDDIEKLVVHINAKGKAIERENDDFVHLKVQAGENWHEFVLWAIENGYGGIENLSLIPGNVGTCPIQNIGAYGVEVKDVITKVEAISIETNEIVTFTNEECKFGYRDSIFKNSHKNKYVITSVSFKLTKQNHKLNTFYGAIENELASKNIENPTIKAISDAVITIRQSKLPDPKETGNSGSFFKNPVVDIEVFENIQEKYPDMPYYKVSEEEIKIPAGWLIEKSGFKGKRFGEFGVHDKQALVLVNFGNASGKDIYNLAKNIKTVVKENFNILLDIEVNVY